MDNIRDKRLGYSSKNDVIYKHNETHPASLEDHLCQFQDPNTSYSSDINIQTTKSLRKI